MSVKQSQERIVLSGPPQLQGVQILLVDNGKPRAWRAYHETFTTCVALKSESPAEWVYRGKTHIARPGAMQLIEPGETHANKKEVCGASFRVLMISPAIMRQAIAEFGGRTSDVHFKIALTFDPILFAAFRNLHSSIENDGSVLEQQTRFAACMKLLAQKCLESPPTPRLPQIHSAAVRKAKAYLYESFNRNVSLEELVRVAGVSQFHLIHSFRHEVGMPPHAYQIQLKLSLARKLLRKGLPIAESAAEAGFSDQSHFTRLFMKFWGITPKIFAESTRRKVVGITQRRGISGNFSQLRS